MKRRGPENLMWRLGKFPEGGFEGSCRRWVFIMANWRKVHSAAPNKFLKLKQRTLLRDPDGSAVRIGTLLGLPDVEIDA